LMDFSLFLRPFPSFLVSDLFSFRLTFGTLFISFHSKLLYYAFQILIHWFQFFVSFRFRFLFFIIFHCLYSIQFSSLFTIEIKWDKNKIYIRAVIKFITFCFSLFPIITGLFSAQQKEPFFESNQNLNVTVLENESIVLKCAVRHKGNKTVSINSFLLLYF
jgi:hypothetical protein